MATSPLLTGCADESTLGAAPEPNAVDAADPGRAQSDAGIDAVGGETDRGAQAEAGSDIDSGAGTDGDAAVDAAPPPCTTQCLYVATTGSDSNPGTKAAPWRTIQHAAGAAVPGDTISIEAGSYDETVTIATSGTSSAPITFVALGDVVIGGNLTIAGSHVVVDGITDSPPKAGGYSAVTINGQYNVLRRCLVTKYGAVADDQATAITFGSTGSFNLVEGCTVKDLDDIDAFHVFGHDNTLLHNVVTNVNVVHYDKNHTDFVQTWGWPGGASYNIVVDGNLVYDAACQLGNLSNDDNADLRDWTFRNNVFYHVGAALFAGVPNTSFYNNVFYQVGAAQGYAVSLYTQTGYSSAGDRFINNVFLNNDIDINFHDAASASGMGTVTTNYFGGANFAPKTNGEFMGANPINGGNPNFVDVAGRNFHLTAGSILVDKGTSLAPAFPDFDGTTRPQGGAWDVGPYELR